MRENERCAGADGVTVAHFASRAHTALPALPEHVNSDAYRPYPLLEILVENKPGSDNARRLRSLRCATAFYKRPQRVSVPLVRDLFGAGGLPDGR